MIPKKRRLRHALVRANIAIRTERPLYPEYSNPVDDSLVDAVGEQGVATLKSWRLMRGTLSLWLQELTASPTRVPMAARVVRKRGR